MKTFTLLDGSTHAARSAETLARRLYGREVVTVRVSNRWEVYRPTSDVWLFLTDIYPNKEN